MLLLSMVIMFLSCKNETKTNIKNTEVSTQVPDQVADTLSVQKNEDIDTKKSTKVLIQELKAKGFNVTSHIDNITNDTIIMQQYFMVFFKNGIIHGQPEEETAVLEKEHLQYLNEIKSLGYADISQFFDDDGDIKGFSIYNVPTLKIADSLAQADPMVKAGQLQVEIHPWWSKKGVSLH